MLIIESGTIRLRIEALSSLGRHRSLYRLLVSFMIFALVYSNQIWHETHRSIWTSTLGFLARLGSPRIGAAKWRCIPIQGTSSSSVEANFVGRWNALTCITERLSWLRLVWCFGRRQLTASYRAPSLAQPSGHCLWCRYPWSFRSCSQGNWCSFNGEPQDMVWTEEDASARPKQRRLSPDCWPCLVCGVSRWHFAWESGRLVFQLPLWDIQPSRGGTSWDMHEPVVWQGTRIPPDIPPRDLFRRSCKSLSVQMGPLGSILNTQASMDIRFWGVLDPCSIYSPCWRCSLGLPLTFSLRGSCSSHVRSILQRLLSSVPPYLRTQNHTSHPATLKVHHCSPSRHMVVWSVFRTAPRAHWYYAKETWMEALTWTPCGCPFCRDKNQWSYLPEWLPGTRVQRLWKEFHYKPSV